MEVGSTQSFQASSPSSTTGRSKDASVAGLSGSYSSTARRMTPPSSPPSASKSAPRSPIHGKSLSSPTFINRGVALPPLHFSNGGTSLRGLLSVPSNRSTPPQPQLVHRPPPSSSDSGSRSQGTAPISTESVVPAPTAFSNPAQTQSRKPPNSPVEPSTHLDATGSASSSSSSPISLSPLPGSRPKPVALSVPSLFAQNPRKRLRVRDHISIVDDDDDVLMAPIQGSSRDLEEDSSGPSTYASVSSSRQSPGEGVETTEKSMIDLTGPSPPSHSRRLIPDISLNAGPVVIDSDSGDSDVDDSDIHVQGDDIVAVLSPSSGTEFGTSSRRNRRGRGGNDASGDDDDVIVIESAAGPSNSVLGPNPTLSEIAANERRIAANERRIAANRSAMILGGRDRRAARARLRAIATSGSESGLNSVQILPGRGSLRAPPRSPPPYIVPPNATLTSDPNRTRRNAGRDRRARSNPDSAARGLHQSRDDQDARDLAAMYATEDLPGVSGVNVEDLQAGAWNEAVRMRGLDSEQGRNRVQGQVTTADGGSGGNWALAQLMAMYAVGREQVAALRGGRGRGRQNNAEIWSFGEDLRRLQGVLGPAGTQQNHGPGLWNETPKKETSKRYAIRLSHPRKLEPGFSRDIIDENEEEEDFSSVPSASYHSSIPPPIIFTSGITTRSGSDAIEAARGSGVVRQPPITSMLKSDAGVRKRKTFAGMLPVCASCLTPLLLAQSGEKRPWALKCGHLVCGKCIGDAKMRCEQKKERERKARWSNVAAVDISHVSKGKEKVDGVDSDGANIVLNPSGHSRNDPKDLTLDTQASSDAESAAGKGKLKAKPVETIVDEAWTCCPVASCEGAGTDLLCKEGDYDGPFEIFV